MRLRSRMILAEKSQEKREMILERRVREERNEIEIGLQSIHIQCDPYTVLL
jgi:hypothetical protein